MSSPSNLYAEKIYAEQPTALWSLDDDCTFVSFISNAGLSLASWSITGGTLSAELASTEDPFAQIVDESFVSITATAATTVQITSTETVTTSSNFSAGVWISQLTNINSVTISVGAISKTFSLSYVTDPDTWIYVGDIFEVTSPLSAQSISISIETSGAAVTYLNGFSIGKNQEFFATKSVGNQLVEFDHGFGVEAYQYGIGENSGWYLGNNTTKELYAKNFSLPLVYGSTASTVLYENPNGPSLMIPGMGFLNESGSKQNLVFETWIRVRADGNTQANPFRIIGPIASSDGVYVYGQHLLLKVDGKVSSHYVGEWFRPMLLNLEYTVEQVRMFVNGEVVSSIELGATAFPDKLDGEINQDFIGFYVGDGVSFMEVDCVAVYPYKLSPSVAKRRFGYGQAVSLPSEIETAYSGKQIAIDYTFAGYSSDYSYPKIESWSSASKDAVYTNRSIMGSPKFIKPDVVLSNQEVSTEAWLNQVIAENVADTLETKPFIRMHMENFPNTGEYLNGYMFYNSIRQQYMQKAVAFFVAGKVESSYSDLEQVIFKIQNKETLDTVSAILSDDTIEYVYNIAGIQDTFATQSVNLDGTFVAGIDSFATWFQTANTKLRGFLRSLSRCSIFIGGDYTGTDQEINTTFAGKIYSFGVFSGLDYSKSAAATLFTDGIAESTSFDLFYESFPTYKVSLLKYVFNEDNLYSLNTSSRSYWHDYIPLSKLAKLTVLGDGSSEYLSDMVQISIDAEYSRIVSSGNIDQTDSDVRCWIHFVYASDVDLSKISSVGTPVVALSENKVIDATSDWENQKFEVVDGTVILMPQINFAEGKTQSDIVMVTSIDIKTRSVDDLPIKIRALEYASQTFNRGTSSSFDINVAKKIGTRTQASPVYMFSQIDSQFDYNAYNPVAISKTMSPYLYMTDKSGIKVLDSYATGDDRGIYIPINKDASPEYYISILSMAMLFNDSEIPAEVTVAEIYDERYGKLRIVLEAVSNDSSRGRLSIKKLVGATWTKLTNVEFYSNGSYVASPELVRGEWSTIGILFVSDPIDASSMSNHKIEIVGSVLVNNIAYFQKRPEELSQQITPNEWNDYDNESQWADFDTESIWSSIYASENQVRPSLSPEIIFDVYSGTNKIISVETTDISGITLENFSYDIINNISVDKTATVSP